MAQKFPPRKTEIKLQMVWEIGEKFGRTRFIHLCDDKGRILGNITRQSLRKPSLSQGDIVLDEVDLSWKEIGNATSLGVGFWDKKLGMPKVDRGPRAMNNQRFQLVEFCKPAMPHSGAATPVIARDFKTILR